jgi:N-acylglucosamine-6-phosphate 2-epimerase
MNNINGGLIVSCQALECEPLYGSNIMGKMALAAFQGGAVGIRANTYEDIVAIKGNVNLPVIGIVKRDYKDSSIYITPTLKEVKEVAAAGAEIVALDCTLRMRPNGEKLDELLLAIRREFPHLLIMADISTFEEGINAERLGVDIISTTLSGYTEYTLPKDGPDLELIKDLISKVKVPVIAEGKIDTPEQAKQCLDLGAYAIVVGGAITRPKQITERFIKAIK